MGGLICQQFVFPQSTGSVDNLQAGIDIGCNVTNVILQGCIFVFHCNFYLVDGMENGGVVTTEFFTDLWQAEVCQFADQIDSNLTGFVGAFIF